MNVRIANGWPGYVLAPFLLLACGRCWADPWGLKPGEFYSEVRGSEFSTETAYASTGDRVLLRDDGSFESRGMTWASELGWKKRVSFLFEIPFESRTRQLPSGLDSTETGFSDLVAGFKLQVLNGPVAVAVTADWKAPLGYNRRLSPALGNGRQEAIGQLELGASIRPLQAFVQIAGGYRAMLERSDDPALPKDQVIASADVGWWLRPSVLLAGSYRGRIESSDAARPEKSHRFGPRIVYRVDDNLDVFAGSLHTAAGENVLHTDQYYVGVAVKKTRLNRLQGFLGGARNP